MNGTAQYALSRVRLHAVACLGASFFSLNSIPLYGCATFRLFGCPSISWWTFASHPLLQLLRGCLFVCLLLPCDSADLFSLAAFRFSLFSPRSKQACLWKGGSEKEVDYRPPSQPHSLQMKKEEKKNAPTQLKSSTCIFCFFFISNGIALCSLGKSMGWGAEG